MPVTRPFLLYLRSRLNLGVSIGAACLVVLSLAFLRPHVLLPVLVVALGYVVVTGVLFFSRAGAREIVEESQEDVAAKVRAKIAAVSAVRERISVLRIGDPGMEKAIELFLLESGAYLEKCRELGTYSPLANERVDRVLEICQVWLGERDQTATARRYELPAQAADTAQSFARDIRQCATVIHDRVTEDLLGTSGSDRLAIMKELEEKK